MDVDGGAILASIIACYHFTADECIRWRELFEAAPLFRRAEVSSIKPISFCVIVGRERPLKSAAAFSR